VDAPEALLAPLFGSGARLAGDVLRWRSFQIQGIGRLRRGRVMCETRGLIHMRHALPSDIRLQDDDDDLGEFEDEDVDDDEFDDDEESDDDGDEEGGWQV
jgi:hypothetical protein